MSLHGTGAVAACRAPNPSLYEQATIYPVCLFCMTATIQSKIGGAVWIWSSFRVHYGAASNAIWGPDMWGPNPEGHFSLRPVYDLPAADRIIMGNWHGVLRT